MNSIVIHGRLVRDPELKEYSTSKGDRGNLCKFTVAVDRRFGDGTDFFDCTVFGKLAEVINKHFSKGREIVVSGSMECDPYEAKDGTKRYPWGIKVANFDFYGSKSDSADSTPKEAPADSFEEIDEDVPF